MIEISVSSPHVGEYDASKICLCFQAFIKTDSGKYLLGTCVSRLVVDRSKSGFSLLLVHFVYFSLCCLFILSTFLYAACSFSLVTFHYKFLIVYWQEIVEK